MGVKIEKSQEVATAFLDGEIDHHTARAIREEIDQSIQRQKPKLLILDFRGVTFMDSSGIGLVMGRFKQVQAYGGKLEVQNVTPQTEKVMKLAGLSRLAVIKTSEKETQE